MTGCSRETVTRIMHQLADSGAVAWDDAELILDERAFARYLAIEEAIADGEFAGWVV
jgi:hypothetical protein